MRGTFFLVPLICGSFGMMCGPIPPPEPDTCAATGVVPVGGLQLGPDKWEDEAFDAWGTTDTAIVTRGIQGGDMLGVTLRVTGDALPACVPQRTRLSQPGLMIENKVPLRTYDAGDGSRSTRTLWLLFDQAPALGSELVLQTEAGGHTVTRQLTVVESRHRLLSLTPLTLDPRVGDYVEFELEMHQAPEYSGVEVSLETTDPAVLGEPAPTITVYGNRETVMVPAVGEGSAELVVRYDAQELRAAVTIAPAEPPLPR